MRSKADRIFSMMQPETEGITFALVAVPVPLGRAFSYSVPSAWSQRVAPGVRVLCEFGRRKVLGVVLEQRQAPPSGLERGRIKPLLSIFDAEPALPLELLSFLRELSSYYLAPIGEVMRLALPTLERSQVERARNEDLLAGLDLASVGRLWQVAVKTEATLSDGELKGNAKTLWQRLNDSGEAPVTELAKQIPNARALVKRLVERNLVRIEMRAKPRDPFFHLAVQRDEPRDLNPAQASAAHAIEAALRAKQSKAFLLDGVTGSGKTEVYLHAVAHCLSQNGGALVLVPEIALTPQLVSRFRARFGDQIAVLHSALSNADRHEMWRRLRSGELRVAVGARSALFAPIPDLRLVCVDEEHDGSFKQEEGVRYHARDMALLRAHRASAVCVLGSATPSLSSEALVRRHKLARLRLPDRAHALAVLPRVEVIDLRRTGAGPSGNRLLSIPLHRAIEETLAAKQQTILFLNRRGFAPSVVCDACGEVVRCPNCSVALTVHRSGRERLSCHYCDYTAFASPRCKECGNQALTHEGAGTERIESVLGSTFPSARIARLDRDIAQGLRSEAVLKRMRDGDVDILVGTQMVTKGHDLPEVTLVGVLNADSALTMPDYQAAERTFQLLVQVAGRAGRAGKAGRVLIQTRNPEHPAVRFALRHDHAAFVEDELNQRREARYPPYARLIMVKVDALDDGVARRTANQLATIARAKLSPGVELLGPSAAPLERLRNRYRYRFLLRAATRRPLYEVAQVLVGAKTDQRVRVHIDVDPVSML